MSAPQETTLAVVQTAAASISALAPICIAVILASFLVRICFGSSSSSSSSSAPIPDRFTSIEELRADLNAAGFEGASLVVGIDCTASNEMMGRRTFGGRSLHALCKHDRNPYEAAMISVIETLADIDADDRIPVFGFGSADTTDKRVLPFRGDDGVCDGLAGVLAAYRAKIPQVTLAGPTSFAPLIHKVIELARDDPGRLGDDW
jgi:E3 ubiquitin-protein ligase RGLG